MAGRGPLPGAGAKDPSQRRRRNKPPPSVRLGPAPTEAPDLPWDGLSELTVERYRLWCRSPQASRFATTDWARLHDLAIVWDAWYASIQGGAPNLDLLKEMRYQEALLGATEGDRKRLGWELPVEPSALAPVRKIRPKLRVVDDAPTSKRVAGTD